MLRRIAQRAFTLTRPKATWTRAHASTPTRFLSSNTAAASTQAHRAQPVDPTASPGRSSRISASRGSRLLPSPGLFGNSHLRQPCDFESWWSASRARVHELLDSVVSRASAPLHQVRDVREAIGALDEVSDVLCQVFESCQLCSVAHDDEEWRRYAQEVGERMSPEVAALNVNEALYECVCKVHRAVESGGAAFTDEERAVVRSLKEEMERSGVHLDAERKQKTIELHGEISALSSQFLQNTLSVDRSMRAERAKLQRLPASAQAMLQEVPSRPDLVDVHVSLAGDVLKWVDDDAVREEMYRTTGAASHENVQVLEAMVARRHELAQTLGHASHVHSLMCDRMAESPEQVQAFLVDKYNEVRDKYRGEVESILWEKARRLGVSTRDTKVFPWDVPYYTGIMKAREFTISASGIARHFPLDKCLEGVGMVVREVFGCRVRREAFDVDEAWSSRLERLVLQDERTGEDLGVVYLDLLRRPNKFSGAAMFPLRSARQLADGSRQLPRVALLNSLSQSGGETLLSHDDVVTLFHEFGHVLHATLSRTEYQHLAGTRGPLDFVEMPSQMMENFAWDYDVVKRFSSIPEVTFSRLRRSRDMFLGLDTVTQLVPALFDQAIFGPRAGQAAVREIVHEIEQQFLLVNPPADVHHEAMFKHLVHYAGAFYSYPFSRVHAERIWARRFAARPLNRESGELFRSLIFEPPADGGQAARIDELEGA